MTRLRHAIGRPLLGLLLVALALGSAAGVHAQAPLTVRTLEHGEWAATIATLQTDLAAQGRVVHVVVEGASGERAPCGGYLLALDDHGARAFEAGACDPTTSATALRLVDRLALFQLGGAVARPRSIGISAMEVRVGHSVGRASLRAESELRCSMAVRPYLVDLATGARVLATPDRFLIRPVGEGARIDAHHDGWTVHAGSVQVEYELVDRESGDVVLRETLALACGAPTPVTSAPSAPDGSPVIDLVPDRVFRGATLTRSRHDDAGSCGGQEGPEQWYVVRLAAPTRLWLRLVSEFDATLYVRQGAIDGPEIACRDQAARVETLDINLQPGVYYVAVDGTGTHGRYRLVSFEEPADPRALAPVVREELANHQTLDDELVPAASTYAASCGGAQAPEHVYWFRVERPSFVSVRLASRFDAALYLLEEGGRELGCQRVLGFPRDVRHSRLGAELPAGFYYVVVDGESGRAATGRYRVAVHQLPLH